LAGGHSLLPMMKLRLAVPEYLIDIDPLAAELGYIRRHDGEIRIGAMTRHRQLLESEVLRERLTIFTDAERVIADPVVRNRGTIGGALCQADPSEDLSAVCAAVGAKVVIRALDGERVVGMRDFYRGPYRTAVGETEMLTEIRVPLRARTGSAYEKVDRRVGDWAVAAAGASVTLGPDGEIACAGVALAAVGADVSCAAVEQALAGQTPSVELFAIARARGTGVRAGHRPARLGRVQAAHRRRADRAHPDPRGAARAGGPCVMQVTVAVNDREHTREIEPRLLLVHFLRDELGLTGTHWGCDTSNCGTCVVLMDGVPVKSCTVLAASAAGHEIRTVEGLEVDGVLDPVQQGFTEEHGLQCGFCTSGMLMTARALLDENPDPTDAEIREAISGQICRCTGYATIVRSIRWAAEHSRQEVQT
jgi:aerobic-type carbon monoxide dehydrogenase small subunit (CoxS/CutS family)/CO/xanthine dehydrogenase FAD-binding subunit